MVTDRSWEVKKDIGCKAGRLESWEATKKCLKCLECLNCLELLYSIYFIETWRKKIRSRRSAVFLEDWEARKLGGNKEMPRVPKLPRILEAMPIVPKLPRMPRINAFCLFY